MFVNRTVAGSIADLDGRLEKGDRVVAVNDGVLCLCCIIKTISLS